MFKFNKKKLWLITLPLFVAVVLVLTFFPVNYEDRGTFDEVEVTDSVEVQEMVCEYGIPVDRYDVHYGIVPLY